MTARPPEDSERGYPAYGDSSGPTAQFTYGEYGQQYAGQPDPFAAPVGQYADPATQYADPATQYGDPATQYGDPATQYPDPATQYGDPATQYPDAASQYGDPASQYGDPATQYGDPAAQYGDPSGAAPPAAGRGRPGMDSARASRGRPATGPGFLGSLFDFDFTSFVTPKIIKSVYLLAVVALGLSAIAFIISGFGVHVPLGVVTRVILAAVYFFLGVAFFRVVLEFFMVVFRMAEDLHDVRERGGSPR
jgi:S-DNA-T family DNA segregation ATPase FtsK/SpoIIIE